MIWEQAGTPAKKPGIYRDICNSSRAVKSQDYGIVFLSNPQNNAVEVIMRNIPLPFSFCLKITTKKKDIYDAEHQYYSE